MSQEDSQQEPTMEEILASIRRIISEDEEEQDGSLDEAVVDRDGFDAGDEGDDFAADDDVESMAADMMDSLDDDIAAGEDDMSDLDDISGIEEESLGALDDDMGSVQDDDVLELTDRVEEEVEDEAASFDDDFESGFDQQMDQATEEDDLVVIEENSDAEESEEQSLLSSAAAGAAAASFGTLAQNIAISRGEGRTLEELVQDMLQPVLKDWLDTNLPGIVEELVREEIERIAKRSSRRS